MTEVVALEERYAEVRERIARAASRAARADSEIILVAVTKNAEPDQIRRLVEMGHRDFAENRVQHLIQRHAMVQEYLARLKVLPKTRESSLWAAQRLLEETPSPSAAAMPDAVRWHMIGHLQRNKARKVVDLCRLIHSVDSLRLAEELQLIAVRREKPVEVLIQVDCAGERSKFGCPMPAVFPLAEQIETMLNVRIRGLMTMAPYSPNPEDARPVFARCRELFEELRTSGLGEGRINILSMGMSGDYEVAIEEGANLVRVGTAIFGEPTHSVADDEDADTDSDED